MPDCVVVDASSPLLDAATFIRILRTNPKTAHVAILLLGDREPVDESLTAVLRKPFENEEALALMEQLLRRGDATNAMSSGGGLEGDLAQMPLADLLQVLAVNRKSGRLELGAGLASGGEIALDEGYIVDASVGRVSGEKALHRLLAFGGGRFKFTHGKPSGSGDLRRRADEALLDAARRRDELELLSRALPGPDELVVLSVAVGALPEELDPVIGEVAALIARPRRVQEVLDRATAADLEVATALATLFERGHARRREVAPLAGRGAGPLLPSGSLRALRSRIGRDQTIGPVVGKVVLLGGGPLARRAALARFASLPNFTKRDGTQPVSFGTIGRLDLGDSLMVDVVAIPSEPALAPLGRPFVAGAVGALLMPPSQEAFDLLRELGADPGIRIVSCGPESPILDDGRVTAMATEPDPAVALGTLLRAVAAPA